MARALLACANIDYFNKDFYDGSFLGVKEFVEGKGGVPVGFEEVGILAAVVAVSKRYEYLKTVKDVFGFLLKSRKGHESLHNDFSLV